MLWKLMGMGPFLAAVMVVVGGLGRLVKGKWPSAPSALLPWLVLVAAYAVVVGDQLVDHQPLRASLQFGLFGCFAGGAAVGGHELAKKTLTLFMSDDTAEVLLGKLESLAKPPAGKSVLGALALLVLLLAFCSGCKLPAKEQGEVDACRAGWQACRSIKDPAEHEACMARVDVGCLGSAAPAASGAPSALPSAAATAEAVTP